MSYFSYYIKEYEKEDLVWNFLMKWVLEKNPIIEIKHHIFKLNNLISEEAKQKFIDKNDLEKVIKLEKKQFENNISFIGKPVGFYYTFSVVNPANPHIKSSLFPKLLLRYKANQELKNLILNSKNYISCEKENNLTDLAFYGETDSNKPLLLCNDGIIYLYLSEQDLEVFNLNGIELFSFSEMDIHPLVKFDFPKQNCSSKNTSI